MSLDAMALVEYEQDIPTDFGTYEHYAVDAELLYTSALADMQTSNAAFAAGEPVDDAAIALASTPRDQVTDPQEIARRAQIIEGARHHFTNRLIDQHGPGVGLHIRVGERGQNWRL